MIFPASAPDVAVEFRDLVLAAPLVWRWIERALGAFLIAFAARLAFTGR